MGRERELTTAETIARLTPLLEPVAPTEPGARIAAARLYREAGQLHQAMDQLLKVAATYSTRT